MLFGRALGRVTALLGTRRPATVIAIAAAVALLATAGLTAAGRRSVAAAPLAVALVVTLPALVVALAALVVTLAAVAAASRRTLLIRRRVAALPLVGVAAWGRVAALGRRVTALWRVTALFGIATALVLVAALLGVPAALFLVAAGVHKLAWNALGESGRKLLELPEMVGLLDDVSALTSAGRMPMADALALTPWLIKDPRREVAEQSIHWASRLRTKSTPSEEPASAG